MFITNLFQLMPISLLSAHGYMAATIIQNALQCCFCVKASQNSTVAVAKSAQKRGHSVSVVCPDQERSGRHLTNFFKIVPDNHQ